MTLGFVRFIEREPGDQASQRSAESSCLFVREFYRDQCVDKMC